MKNNSSGDIESYLLIDKEESLIKSATSYLMPGEKLINALLGGGESLVMFIKKPNAGSLIVRKVWDSKLQILNWRDNEKITMTPPVKKGYLQIQYINSLPKQVKSYFPKIYKSSIVYSRKNQMAKVICDESYIPGLEVSRFIYLYKPTPYIVSRLYTEIFKCLGEIIHVNRKTKIYIPTVEASYLSKISDRLRITKRKIPKVISSLTKGEYIIINGKRYINTPTLIRKIRQNKFINILEPYHHNLVVGDTNTQNIKITNVKYLLQKIDSERSDFTYKELGIKFLDPRSLGFNSAGENTTDDYMYDNKPFHNSLGNYDMIYGKHFNLNISNVNDTLSIIITEYKNPYANSYSGLEKYFKLIMEDSWHVNDSKFLEKDPYWIIRFTFLMGTHFSAMLPFQLDRTSNGNIADDYTAQKRAVAIYCEGVKWLNIAYKMLLGDIKEYYGFILPEIKNTYEN